MSRTVENKLIDRQAEISEKIETLVTNIKRLVRERLNANVHDEMLLHTLASNIQELANAQGKLEAYQVATRMINYTSEAK